MTVVVFDPVAFNALFPAFASVSPTVEALYFDVATTYVANTDCAIIPYSPPQVTTRATVLYFVTAHLLQLFVGANGQGPSPFVGPVSDATQGSVSVSTKLGDLPTSATWWATTTYGLTAWQMMAAWRTAQYRASPGRFAQIPGYVGGPLGVAYGRPGYWT
jgi:hypothetical protein